MVSVAPASRRLLALSCGSKTAGKMPALPQRAAAFVRHNSRGCCLKGLVISNCSITVWFERSQQPKPRMLECANYNRSNRAEELKNEALSRQGDLFCSCIDRSGFTTRTYSVFNGSGRGADAVGIRSCRTVTGQAEFENYTAAIRGHTARSRRRKVDA